MKKIGINVDLDEIMGRLAVEDILRYFNISEVIAYYGKNLIMDELDRDEIKSYFDFRECELKKRSNELEDAG